MEPQKEISAWIHTCLLVHIDLLEYRMLVDVAENVIG